MEMSPLIKQCHKVIYKRICTDNGLIPDESVRWQKIGIDPIRLRKKVESKVIEPKQLTGKSMVKSNEP